MNNPSDLAIMVAQSQERIGSLNGKIDALHTRQDKMEGEIKETLKEIVAEMKSLKASVDADFKQINAYINKQKGQATVIKAIIVSAIGAIGTLIGKYLLK